MTKATKISARDRNRADAERWRELMRFMHIETRTADYVPIGPDAPIGPGRTLAMVRDDNGNVRIEIR